MIKNKPVKDIWGKTSGLISHRHKNPFLGMHDKEVVDKEVKDMDKEETEEYFLGPDPRKHKDYKHFKGN